jgi:hypothetical protein
MTRSLVLILAVYAPHLLEEAVTRMYDDPLIVAAFGPLSRLSPRHSTYLTFQIMLALSLGMTLLFSLDGWPRRIVLAGLAVALLCESHHLIRAVWTLNYNPGLATALPMPIVGAVVLRRAFAERGSP